MKFITRQNLSIALLAVLCSGAAVAQAPTPRTISFQGVLADVGGTFIADGAHSVTLRIYDAPVGGTALFTETQNLTVVRGIFNTSIGSTLPEGLPSSLRFDRAYYLGVTVNGGVELSPRTAMTAVPYAFAAEVADSAATAGHAAMAEEAVVAQTARTVQGGAVTSLNGQQGAVNIIGADGTTITTNGNTLIIGGSGGSGSDDGIKHIGQTDNTLRINNAFGPLTTIDVAESGIRTEHLVDGAVITPKILNGAVTETKLADAVISTSKLMDNAVTSAKIAPGAITSSDIADNSITSPKIVDGQVMTSDIADYNVTNLKVAPDAISSDKIVDGQVMHSDIADLNVITSKIATSAVTSDKIADGQVMTADIAGLNVTGSKIAADAISSDKIADGQVMTSDIADLNVITSKIAASAITTDKIADGQVMNADLANNAVNAAKIDASGSTVGQSLISNGSSTPVWGSPVPGGAAGGDLAGSYPNPTVALNAGNNIVAAVNDAQTTVLIDYSRLNLTNNVQEGDLVDNAVSTNKLADGSVTTPKLADAVVTGQKIATAAVATEHIADGAVTTPKLADASVTGQKIAVAAVDTEHIVDAAVTDAKIESLSYSKVTGAPTSFPPSGAAGGDLTGTYPNPTVANDAINSAKIADGQVQNADLSANSVTTSKVANGTVTTSKMADSAVSGLKLLTYAVTDRHIADGAITLPKISASGAASGQIIGFDGSNVVWTASGASGAAGGDLTGTYPNPTVANDAITTGKIADNAITTAKIADGQVQNQDIAANAITTSKVANGTVTTSKMADSAISGLKLLTYAVTDRHIADGAVTTGKINTSGASNGQVLGYNGSSVVWTTPSTGTTTNSTLTGAGTSGSPLGINLGNSNTWTANQTFGGTFLITSNSRIAMTNSDNNARDIRFQEPSGTGSQYIGLRAPSVSNNGNYVLPAVVGAAGQVMGISTSNGIDSATLGWITPMTTIDDGSITTAKLADGAVTDAKVAMNSIAYNKLNLTNSIANSDLTANSVTTSKVANGTVTTSKMADSAISGLKLLTYAVTNRHLAANSVTTDKIDPSGATTGQVLGYNGSSVVWTTPSGGGTVNRNATLSGDGSAGSPLGINLGNSNTWTANQTFGGTFVITSNSRIAMTNSDNNARDIRFQEPSGTGSQYIGLRAPSVSNNGNYVLPAVVGSVGQVMGISTSNGIDSATLGWITPSATVADGSITTAKLADDAVTLAKLSTVGAATGQVLSFDGTNATWSTPSATVADGSITTAKLADGAITDAKVAMNSIAYNKLNLTNSISNGDIVANAITTSKVANGTVTTSKLADSAVSGLKLLTYAVTNRHLAAQSVTTDKINTSGASVGNVLAYNGTSVAWARPTPMFGRTEITSANSPYTMNATNDLIGVNQTTAITITLPAANSVPAGKVVIINAEQGTYSGSTPLTIQAASGNTVNGGSNLQTTVIYTTRRLYSDGVSAWYTF